MIQHNILEVVNLQMERFLFWYFSNAWLCASSCLYAVGDQRKYL